MLCIAKRKEILLSVLRKPVQPMSSTMTSGPEISASEKKVSVAYEDCNEIRSIRLNSSRERVRVNSSRQELPPSAESPSSTYPGRAGHFLLCPSPQPRWARCHQYSSSSLLLPLTDATSAFWITPPPASPQAADAASLWPVTQRPSTVPLRVAAPLTGQSHD